MGIHYIYKTKGETPLQALARFKQEMGIEENVSVTYAGRLDPTAEGILVLVSGEDIARKQEILDLPKTYEFEVLFGVSTDSLDVLGVPNQESCVGTETSIVDPLSLKNFVGSFEWQYPDYSSKTVGGVPLFSLARNQKKFQAPTRTMTIYSLESLGVRTQNVEDLKPFIRTTIFSVSGDFRQEEVWQSWQKIFEGNPDVEFCTVLFRACVASGTYIRVLASKMGEVLGVPALALSIKRTQVGDVGVEDVKTKSTL